MVIAVENHLVAVMLPAKLNSILDELAANTPTAKLLMHRYVLDVKNDPAVMNELVFNQASDGAHNLTIILTHKNVVARVKRHAFEDDLGIPLG